MRQQLDRKPPVEGAPEIVWRVFLGLNTAARLARETGITPQAAGRALRNACALRLIERERSGLYHLPRRRYTGMLAKERAMQRDPRGRFHRLDREKRRQEAEA